MSKIISKLNLNKTPALVDSNSMVFAKNIRVESDGAIYRDWSIKSIKSILTKSYNTSSYFYTFYTRLKNNIENIPKTSEYYEAAQRFIKDVINKNYTVYTIIKAIPYNTGVYILFKITNNTTKDNIYKIIKYEEGDTSNYIQFYPCACNWTYHNGDVWGYVINNLLGETILCIAESNADTDVPFKCINLNKSTYDDDESIYTQTPNVPIINLNYKNNFSYSIPNGCYQFFIRYKIRNNFYTNWFPASSELFTGNSNTINTGFGSLRYVNTHKDSDFSFVFNVDNIITDYNNNYESFQIGFICSHDDTIVARAWKHFNFDIKEIQFDYKAADAEEIEITDLTKPVFNIYNVGNVTSFKNKMYISNYTETEFNDKNEDIKAAANEIKIELKTVKANNTYAGHNIKSNNITYVNSYKYINGFQVDDNYYSLKDKNGLIYKLLDTSDSYTLDNRKISDILLFSNIDSDNVSNLNDLQCFATKDNFSTLVKEKTDWLIANVPNIIKSSIVTPSPVEGDKPELIKINDVTYTEDIDIDAEKVLHYIYSNIAYLRETGDFADTTYNIIGGIKYDDINRIKIIYRWGIDYQVTKPSSGDYDTVNTSSISSTDATIVNHTTFDQIIYLTFKATGSFNLNDTENFTKYTTLIPYQKYKFYIHFVKPTGEITNGYYCSGENAGEIEIPYRTKCDAIIYPSFSGIKYPKGYVACFFSILHSKQQVSTVFDISNADTTDDREAYDFDINMRLIPSYNNIKIQFKTDDVSDIEETAIGNYYDSNYYDNKDAIKIKYFGADGIIYIKDAVNVDTNHVAYAVNDYVAPDDEYIELIKCTPYINENNTTKDDTDESYTFDAYGESNLLGDLNLLGYICNIQPLDHNRCYTYYSDGNNVYYKDYKNAESDKIKFIELGKYTDSSYHYSSFTPVNSPNVFVYSNYNLNYLSLTDEPKQTIKIYYNYPSTQTSTTDKNTISVLLFLLSSLTLSDTYELVSMYKSYTRKTYSPYKTNEVTRFDNTIRASNVVSDEEQLNIFTFEADNYYNIPTNKGKIVNLIAAGDAILAHTRDSMFKFTGSNILQSSSGEIQQAESDVFTTGVSEVFGSDFGYGGLQDKLAAIVTEAGYIFFDSDSNTLYMYSGQGQIIKLSDAVEKLFRRNTINTVRLANDYYNNRFFITISFIDNYCVTLSYSLIDSIKSFISLHDFTFSEAFNTKTKCYFINNNYTDITFVCKNFTDTYDVDLISKSIYPESKNKTYQFYSNFISQGGLLNYYFDSIIDVINNDNYENVSTLNYISWSANNYNIDIDSESRIAPIYSNMASNILNTTTCKALGIYTDTCATDNITCTTVSNDKEITDIEYNKNNTKLPYYACPRYNQGFWTLNYFRDVKNTDDKFNYLQKYNDGHSNSPYRSDNQSLIEGRYFVARFVFDGLKKFVFDTITFNTDKKL